MSLTVTLTDARSSSIIGAITLPAPGMTLTVGGPRLVNPWAGPMRNKYHFVLRQSTVPEALFRSSGSRISDVILFLTYSREARYKKNDRDPWAGLVIGTGSRVPLTVEAPDRNGHARHKRSSNLLSDPISVRLPPEKYFSIPVHYMGNPFIVLSVLSRTASGPADSSSNDPAVAMMVEFLSEYWLQRDSDPSHTHRKADSMLWKRAVVMALEIASATDGNITPNALTAEVCEAMNTTRDNVISYFSTGTTNLCKALRRLHEDNPSRARTIFNALGFADEDEIEWDRNIVHGAVTKRSPNALVSIARATASYPSFLRAIRLG